MTREQAASRHTNRLISETSPYLLQHAHNPFVGAGLEAFYGKVGALAEGVIGRRRGLRDRDRGRRVPSAGRKLGR